MMSGPGKTMEIVKAKRRISMVYVCVEDLVPVKEWTEL